LEKEGDDPKLDPQLHMWKLVAYLKMFHPEERSRNSLPSLLDGSALGFKLKVCHLLFSTDRHLKFKLKTCHLLFLTGRHVR